MGAGVPVPGSDDFDDGQGNGYAYLEARDCNGADGRSITNAMTVVLEKLRLAPKGTKQVSDFLNEGADALVAGGRTGTFTSRKP